MPELDPGAYTQVCPLALVTELSYTGFALERLDAMHGKFEVLGRGIYSIPEASKYTGVHPNTVRAWLDTPAQSGRNALLLPDFRSLGRGLSFLDLIEVLVIGELRRVGVSLQTIRKAHEAMVSELKTVHPFSHKDIFTDGKKVFVRITDRVKPADLCEVLSKQGHFWEVMIQHLKQIDYSEDLRLAERWRIAQGIVIDPAVSFGKPVISRRRTTTRAIAMAYYANEEDYDLVADLFDIRGEDVRHAVDFERKFGIAA
jgi:uncharacterized protein (DUF433 family)